MYVSFYGEHNIDYVYIIYIMYKIIYIYYAYCIFTRIIQRNRNLVSGYICQRQIEYINSLIDNIIWAAIYENIINRFSTLVVCAVDFLVLKLTRLDHKYRSFRVCV